MLTASTGLRDQSHMKNTIFCIFLIFCSVYAFAADVPLILNFPAKTYQASNQIWSIAQDQHGIIYAGNNDGLLEFDGANWELHPLPNGQTARAVASDQGGRIYCGSYGEFGFWQRDQLGSLYYTSLSKQVPHEDIRKEEFWHILVYKNVVYFQSFGVMYQYSGKKVTRVPAYFPFMFIKECNGRLLIPAIRASIYELGTNQKVIALSGSDFFANQTITALIADPAGLLVGTSHEGIFRQKGNSFVPWEHPVNAELKRYQLNKAIRLRDGRLALGTILNGVFIVKGEQIQYHLNQNNGLQNNTILSLFEDKKQNLWLGLDKGLDLVALHDPMLYYTDREGEIGSIYTAAIHQKRLFIGSNQGVFYRSWPLLKNERYQLLPGSQGQVWQLAVFDDQLLCGHNEGTFVVDGNQFRRISSVTGGWWFVHPPQRPEYLLQGTYTGLVVFRKDATGHWQFSHQMEGLKEPLQKLVFQNARECWAVNPYESIYHLTLDSNYRKITAIDTINVADGLPANSNLDVFLKGNEVWIWSRGRQFIYQTKTKQCQPAPLKGETQSKFFQSSAGEMFEILPQQVRIKKDQQLTSIINTTLATHYNPIVELQNGAYLFCIDNGYALLNRLDALEKSIESSLRIKKIESLNPKNRHKIYRKDGVVYFPAGTRTLRFVFSIDDYTRTTFFRYRLKEEQKQWSGWSRFSEREFSSLSPGHYTLEIQHDLSEHTTSCSFVIAPHWYQTSWMYLLYFLSLVGLYGLLNRVHQRRLHIQRRKLLLEKERELHQQRIQNRNIQLQNDVLNKSKELASSTFHLIRKNEALLQIKEELIRFKAESGDRPAAKHYQKMLRLVDEHLGNEQDWQVFEDNFNQVHDEFFKKLKSMFPSITPGDLRLAAYLRMNLSSKEIAPLLHLSIRGIENKRYRLRRKLELDGDDNLVEFLMSL